MPSLRRLAGGNLTVSSPSTAVWRGSWRSSIPLQEGGQRELEARSYRRRVTQAVRQRPAFRDASTREANVRDLMMGWFAVRETRAGRERRAGELSVCRRTPRKPQGGRIGNREMSFKPHWTAVWWGFRLLVHAIGPDAAPRRRKVERPWRIETATPTLWFERRDRRRKSCRASTMKHRSHGRRRTNGEIDRELNEALVGYARPGDHCPRRPGFTECRKTAARDCAMRGRIWLVRRPTSF